VQHVHGEQGRLRDMKEFVIEHGCFLGVLLLYLAFVYWFSVTHLDYASIEDTPRQEEEE